MREKRLGFIFIVITLVLYILTVLWYTVLQRPISFQTSKYELFWSYKEWLNGDIALGKQILTNVAMFIPFGLLLSLLLNQQTKNIVDMHKRVRWIPMIILAALFSFVIECSQLIFVRGMFEFDDVLDNTLGALLGTILFRILRLLPAKYRKMVVTTICIAILVVCAGVVVNESTTGSVQADKAPTTICFQVDQAELEGNQLTLTGCAFDYARKFKNWSLVLRSTDTGKEIALITNLGYERSEVNRYFECEADYCDTGFCASGIVAPLVEYELRLKPQWLTSISIGVYITGTDIHYAPSASFAEPNLSGTTVEPVVKEGFLRAYRPDVHCWVYQYDGALYWIADQNFFFEADGSTYIQYHLHTTQIQNLPQHRLENNWFWDNIGDDFELYELEGDFGQYRVMKRELPTEYAITSITTGYYQDGQWIWQECFRPIYTW